MSTVPPTICLPASVFRANLFVLLDWVKAEQSRVVVHMDGEPVAVLAILELDDEPADSPRRLRLRRKIASLLGQSE